MHSTTQAVDITTLTYVAKSRKKTEPTLETARTVGERIRAAYLSAGMNRSQLQRALGVAYTTILAWERDESAIGSENLAALSVVTGVSPSVILGEDEPVTEAEYEAWGRFLATDAGRGMQRWERKTLGSMRFYDETEATVERYTALLMALRMTAPPASAAVN